MSYLPKRLAVNSQFNLYHVASVSSVAVNQDVAWASQATTGYDFTFSQSGADFYIPNDGHTYIFEASLAPTTNNLSSDGVSHQWYDITNSGFIGNAAIGLVALNDAEYVMSEWADERARCYVRATSGTIRIRLRITAIHGVTPTGVDGTYFPYETRARCVVWRL